MRNAGVKRALDLAGSVIGLVVFAIPMAVVAALIRLTQINGRHTAIP